LSDSVRIEGFGEARAYNLKSETKYYAAITSGASSSEKIEIYTEAIYPRFISVEGTTNVRDVGGAYTVDGHRIRRGLLFRGSEMNSHHTVTQDGLRTMRELLKIRSVLDLRNSKEAVADVYKGNYLHVAVTAYSEFLDDADAVFRIMSFLSDEENYPIYVHCWGGADRTGTLIFLLELLLKMQMKDIAADYEATSLAIYGARSVNMKVFRDFTEKLRKYEGADLCEKAISFFLSCGVSRETLDNIKRILTE
jgi:hypothetical protein